MASPVWPRGSITADELYEDWLRVKAQAYPEHTVRDPLDPFNTIGLIIAALGEHAATVANSALTSLTPSAVTSRRALLALLARVNRPLRPMTPARGKVVCELSSAPSGGAVIASAGLRFTAGSSDPSYTLDADLVAPDSTTAAVSKLSAGNLEAFDALETISLSVDDRLVVSFGDAMVDGMTIALSDTISGAIFCPERSNITMGTPTEIEVVSPSEIKMVLDEYLLLDEVSSDAVLVGLAVRVVHRPSGVGEDVVVELDGGQAVVFCSALGQVEISPSRFDYDVFAEWLPLPVSTAVTFSGSTTVIEFDLMTVLTTSSWWHDDPSWGRAISFRMVSGSTGTIAYSSVTVSGSWYLEGVVTQGRRVRRSLGPSAGTALERLALPSQLIDEPSASPPYTLEVDGEAWEIADTLASSTSNSKHALLHEGPNGWAVMFGTGVVGQLPADGASVFLTYRTDSLEAGDQTAGTVLRPGTSVPSATAFSLPAGAVGYMAREADQVADVINFRVSKFPTTQLRENSVVTRADIVSALTGGAPGRATFTTDDGRRPFSRAYIDTSGTAEFKTYTAVVVGLEADAQGTVATTDTTQAEEWLNGIDVGFERVGGHGPVNSQAVVVGFTRKSLIPTISIVSKIPIRDARAQVDAVIRLLLRPSARGSDGTFLWEFGGTMPVSVLFANLWDTLGSIIDKTAISPLVVTMTDGSTTWTIGQAVPLGLYGLPALDAAYSSAGNITVTVTA